MPDRTSSVKRPIHPRGGKISGKSIRARARAGRVRPGVAVLLECKECRARYIAVLADDPPDWKPHCIECDTPFGPVLGRAVHSLFAVID